MKKRIKRFIADPKRKILIIKHDFEHNSLQSWQRVVSPFKVMYVFLVGKISNIFPLKLKNFVLRKMLGAKIGRHAALPWIDIDKFYPEMIHVGDNVIIGYGTRLFTHEFMHDHFKFGKIYIKKNALVGSFSTIRCGVTIGENSIVGMCSFVNKDIPANEMWGGVPARLIKKIDKKK